MSSTKRWLCPASAFLWVGMLSQPTSTPSPWAEPSLSLPPLTVLQTPGASVAKAIFFEASLGQLPAWRVTGPLGQGVNGVTWVERLRVGLSLWSLEPQSPSLSVACLMPSRRNGFLAEDRQGLSVGFHRVAGSRLSLSILAFLVCRLQCGFSSSRFLTLGPSLGC